MLGVKMIFGDPYKFAIQLDFVDDWVSKWGADMKNEGTLHYIIEGYIQPSELKSQSVTILNAVDSFKVKRDQLNQVNTQNLYYQNAKDIFETLEGILTKILNGDETNEEYEIYISTHLNIEENMFDNQNSWLVSTEEHEKIVFRCYKNNIHEIILDKGYCIEVIDKAIVWAEKYFNKASRSLYET